MGAGFWVLPLRRDDKADRLASSGSMNINFSDTPDGLAVSANGVGAYNEGPGYGRSIFFNF